MNTAYTLHGLRFNAFSILENSGIVINANDVDLSELMDDAAPLDICNQDAFDVITCFELTSFIDASSLADRVANFEGCTSALSAVFREATAIVSLVHSNIVYEIENTLSEVVGFMIDSDIEIDGTPYTAALSDFTIVGDLADDCQEVDSKEIDGYEVEVLRAGKKLFARFTYVNPEDAVTIIISADLQEND